MTWQTLGVPYIENSGEDDLAIMPRLAYLRRLYCYNIDSELLNIDGHPFIIEVGYRGHGDMGPPTSLPHLPALRRMFGLGGSHLAKLIQRYQANGDTLPFLDTITF